MQGGLEQPNSNILSYFKNSYANRKAPTEFFSSFVLPTDKDTAYRRANENIPKFSFYYLLIAAFFAVIFLMAKMIALIPISIAVGCYFVSQKNFKVSDYELTPNIVLYACIAINVLIALFVPSIGMCYLLLFSFLAIATVIILAHACLHEDRKDENINDI